MLYHSGSGKYKISNGNLEITFDKSFKVSNSSTIITEISADKNNIYVPIDSNLDVKRAFTKTK